MNIMDVKKNLFKTVISDYEYGRPKYPEELYEAIQSFSGICAKSTILEVGAGTGQATDQFASRGYHLDLLEVSGEQVDYLREKYAQYSNVNVTQSYFEEYTPDKEYDLIYSATAFHWIKCEDGYPKAWRMLREGGTMAVFWDVFFDMKHSGGIFEELNELKKCYLPGESLGLTLEEIKEKRIGQITTGGWFGKPEYYEFHRQTKYNSSRFLAYLKTYSGTLMLDADVRERYLTDVSECLARNGGSIDIPETVSLYLVRKEGDLH